MRASVRPLKLGFALVLVLAGASRVAASPVTITGGFTSFTGVSSGTGPGCDLTLKAVMAGTPLNAPSCTAAFGHSATSPY